jgi:hypothetical protein
MGDALYDRDFYLWTQDQAQRLRALDGDNRLDTQHLAEEVADLGRAQLNQVSSHLRQAFIHLIKAGWVDDARLRAGWAAEVRGHLDAARDAFTPGMRQHLDPGREWRRAWPQANGKLIQNGDPALPEPIGCPFSLAELIDPAFDVEAAIQRAAGAFQDAAASSGG